jgi:chromate transporter
VQGALRGMAAVSAGLIAGTGLKLVVALRFNTMGIGACAALAVLSFIAIALMRMPLVWVLLCLGLPATFWAYHCLLKQAKNPGVGR